MSSVTPPEETSIPDGAAAPDAHFIASDGKRIKKRGAALGTWALVLGIIGTVFSFIPATAGFGAFLGGVALLLGLIGLVRRGRRAVAGTVLGIVALVLGITFSHTDAGSATGSSSAGGSSSTSVASSGGKASVAPAKAAAPSKPAGTAGELQALVAATGYLSDGQGFSAAGLLHQLTSTSGDGFPQADAQWAITQAGANWNAQALTAAKGYLSDGQGFSEAGLTSQLTSANGDQFAAAQAQYAIAHSGADWNAQAVIAAKGYMSDGEGFSRSSLIDQLSSAEGGQFTAAQAEYAAGQVGLH